MKQKTIKPSFPKAIPPGVGASANAGAATGVAPAPVQQPRSTLADWAAAEDDDYTWKGGEKRQRGGRRKRKKKDDQRMETDWDELYDPARPTNVEEYLRSDERIREVQEWKAVLYAHRRRRKPSYESDEDDEDEDHRPAVSSMYPSCHNLAGPLLFINTYHGCYRPVCSASRILLCTTSSLASARQSSSCSTSARRECRRGICSSSCPVWNGSTSTAGVPYAPTSSAVF